jgi:hypothetical protein
VHLPCAMPVMVSIDFSLVRKFLQKRLTADEPAGYSLSAENSEMVFSCKRKNRPA